ncbi:hypothetical protein F7Q99_36035 [Streptomyces kaniharaensis]|uniref:Uncharacterized protein n=1 Tax=Streptomyces kaniharaensis TaxID=212423 RepID=A0A6N7L0T0_9ACTN|nr:hypothetical protein [Streptomyces kaniharaensis]MQS17452.1 hypothetical protein [Streptomyces kaniharaensis]
MGSVYNSIGDGAVLRGLTIQAGNIGFVDGTQSGDGKPSSALDLLDTEGAPVALTRGEYEALNAYLGERTDPTARALHNRLADR